MEIKTQSGELSEPLRPCPQCQKPRDQDRGDVRDGLCWRCRSRAAKVADVFLAAEKLRSDLRVDPANAPTIYNDLDAREFILHESVEEMLTLVDELAGEQSYELQGARSLTQLKQQPTADVAQVDGSAQKKRRKNSSKTKKSGRPTTITRDKKLATKFAESDKPMIAFAESENLPESTCRTAVKRGQEVLKCAKNPSGA